MSGNVRKSISGHFRKQMIPVEYSKKFSRGIELVIPQELSKTCPESAGETNPTGRNFFLAILPNVRPRPDFRTFPDISGHAASRTAPQQLSGHFRTHGDSTVVKSQTGTFQRIQPIKKRLIRRREPVRSILIGEIDRTRSDIGVPRAKKLPLTFRDDL